MFYHSLSPETNPHTTSGQSSTFAPGGKHRLLARVTRKDRYPAPIPLLVCLVILCLLFTGCTPPPTLKGVYIMKENRYVALKSFPLEINVQNVRAGIIRTYSLVDETLAGAGTYKSRKHLFLINSPYEEFKVVRVTKNAIIKNKHIGFKNYVYFTEIKVDDTTEISITGDHLLLEVHLDPGRYVLIPWMGHSPSEPIGYGLIVK